MSKADVLKELGRVEFDAPDVEGEAFAGAGFPDPGVYSTGQWKVTEITTREGDDGVFAFRLTVDTETISLRVDLSVDPAHERAFATRWKFVRGFFAAAKMPEKARKRALSACKNPGKRGNLAKIVALFGEIEDCPVLCTYTARGRGYPQYSALPPDADPETFRFTSLSALEAAELRIENSPGYDDDDADDDDDDDNDDLE